MTKPRRKPKKPGPAPLAEKREQYLRLMAQGMSNSAACRELGINRRTGTRWRYGRKVVDRAANASTRRSPNSGTPSRSRRAICPRTSGSSSPTCSGPRSPCAPLPASSAAAPPRSAARYACGRSRFSARSGIPWRKGLTKLHQMSNRRFQNPKVDGGHCFVSALALAPTELICAL